MADQQMDFWSKKEGQFAKWVANPLILGALGIAAFWFWGTISAFVVMALTNMLYAVGLFAALAFLAYLAFAEQPRTLIRYGYQAVMRMITSFFVTLDPIGIMKDYIKDLLAELEYSKKKRDILEGQREKLRHNIETATAEHEKCMQEASFAEGKPEYKEAYLLAVNQAGRLEEAMNDYLKQASEMDELMETVERMMKASDFMIKDLTNTVKIQSERRETILAGYGAMKGVRSILKGEGTAKELFDQSLEHTIADYDMKMGEIKAFRRDSEGILQGMDLKNGAMEAKAKAQMEKWKKKSHEVLVRVDTSTPAQPAALPAAGVDDWFTNAPTHTTVRR